MRTTTRSTVKHVTQLISDRKRADGGRALLIEAFDFIREEKQVGNLIAAIGPGGAIRGLRFEEEDVILQRDISVAE